MLLLAELAAQRKSTGSSLTALLDEIAITYGLHATDQLSVRVTDLSEIDVAMARLRANPPRRLGGREVSVIDDLSRGAGDLPPTDGLRFRLDGGGRVIVRPSGTEPKIKCYLEVVVPVEGGDVAGARTVAADELADLRTDIALAAGLS